jgi:hypothetical protein
VVIYIFGDSHAFFFSGTNAMETPHGGCPQWVNGEFALCWLGARLAWKLKADVQIILDVCRFQMKPEDEGALCFGEIDCRCHILKHRVPGESTASAVKRVVTRYVRVARKIRHRAGHKWTFIGPGPSAPKECGGDQWYATTGTTVERNLVTQEFNGQLREAAKLHGFGFCTCFDLAVNQDMTSKEELFRDEVHLHQRAWPLIQPRWEARHAVQ